MPFHRFLCLVFVALGSILAVQHDPGREHTLATVLLAHPVLAYFASAALLVVLAFAPERAFRGAREGGSARRLLVATAAVGMVAGGAWLCHEIGDAYLGIAVLILGPVNALTLWGRAAGDAKPIALCSVLLVGASVLFGAELDDDDHGRPVSVLWGDEQTFAMLFAKEPPYIGPGGRLVPNLDVYMHSKDLPQGARLRTNSLGFRNVDEVPIEKDVGTVRLLSLGDSFSIGMQIGQNEFYGPRVERALSTLRSAPVEVVNAEISDPAYGLWYFQQHGHAYRPDVVLLGICANDMLQADDSFAIGDERRLFRLDENGRVHADPEAPRVDNHVRRYAELAYPRAAVRDPALAREPLDFGSAARRMRGKLLRFELLRAFAPNDARRHTTPRVMHSYAEKYEQEDGRKRYFDGVANLGAFAKDPPPVVDALYAKLFAILHALDGQVRASGGRLVVVLFPQRFQVHPEDWDVMRAVWNLDAADFDLDAPSERIRAGLAERGVAVCDLLPAFRAEAGGGTLFISGGDMHPNNAGHALAADETARFVDALLGD